jgi:hypothetical protein
VRCGIGRSKPASRFQIKLLLQGSQRYRDDLTRVLTYLAVKVPVTVSGHRALEDHRVNAQRADLITRRQRFLDLLCLGFQNHSPAAAFGCSN